MNRQAAAESTPASAAGAGAYGRGRIGIDQLSSCLLLDPKKTCCLGLYHLDEAGRRPRLPIHFGYLDGVVRTLLERPQNTIRTWHASCTEVSAIDMLDGVDLPVEPGPNVAFRFP